MRRTEHDHARPRACDDEPRAEGDGWEDYGGALMWVVGHTEGGAPNGLTVDEFRLANERSAGDAEWARAKFVLDELFELSSEPDTRVEVGWVRKYAEGMSREIFAAEVDLTPDRARRSGPYVVLLPRPDSERDLDQRVRKELRLLARLSSTRPPFGIPECVGAYPVSGRLALVRRFVRGVELDLRVGRQPGLRPWETLGGIMAAIHGLEGDRFADILPGSATRRGHALEALRVFDGLDGPEMGMARAWAAAHLPSDEPSVLL